MLIVKKVLLFLTFLLSVSLFGCHSNYLSNNLNLTEDISSIEVYEWDSDILVTNIKDNELIDELVKELNSAKTYSTADMDYPLPGYELIFIDNEQEDIFSIGYYNEIVNLGVKGRYLDVREDIMYQVELQLPFY